jgi:hypothetical protein
VESVEIVAAEESVLVGRIVVADLVEIVGVVVVVLVETVVEVAVDIERGLLPEDFFAVRKLPTNKMSIAQVSKCKNSTFSWSNLYLVYLHFTVYTFLYKISISFEATSHVMSLSKTPLLDKCLIAKDQNKFLRA